MIAVVAATSAEGDALAALHESCFPDAWTSETFRRLIEQPGVTAWLAQTEGRNIGFVLARVALDESEILSLGVSPALRRRGTGALLLAHAARQAAAAGAVKIFLEVGAGNGPALRLYRKSGFHEVGRRRGYYGNGTEDGLTMRADLPLTPLGN
jgi:[ribosomal protein S18]-alanine N-acetyltransferase